MAKVVGKVEGLHIQDDFSPEMYKYDEDGNVIEKDGDLVELDDDTSITYEQYKVKMEQLLEALIEDLSDIVLEIQK